MLFPVLEILSFSLFSFSNSIKIRSMAGEERHQNVLIPHRPHALCHLENSSDGSQARSPSSQELEQPTEILIR